MSDLLFGGVRSVPRQVAAQTAAVLTGFEKELKLALLPEGAASSGGGFVAAAAACRAAAVKEFGMAFKKHLHIQGEGGRKGLGRRAREGERRGHQQRYT